jgi:hypothetical protein
MVGQLLGLLTLVASTAEPTALSAVEWDVPAGCPAATRLTDAVSRFVGRPIDADVRRLDVTVALDVTGSHTLTLTLETTAGIELRETLRDRDCEVVVDAAALKVAFAIDPEATAIAIEAPAPPSEPEPERTPPPKADPTPPPDPGPATEPATEPLPTRTPSVPARPDAPTPSRNEPPRLRSRCAPGPRVGASRRPCADLGVHAGLHVGPLPRVGPGLGGGVAVLWPRLAVRISAAHWFAQTTRLAGRDTGGRLRLTTVDVAACARLGVRTVEFPLCGGLQLGSFFGRGIALDDPNDERLLWAAAIAHGGLTWVVARRFAPFVRAGLAVPLSAYRFHVNASELVHSAAPVAFQAALGAAVRVW